MRLPHQLDEIGRRSIPKAKARKTQNVRAFLATLLARVQAQRFRRQLYQDGEGRGVTARLNIFSESGSRVLANNDQDLAAVLPSRRKGVLLREGPALSGTNDLIVHLRYVYVAFTEESEALVLAWASVLRLRTSRCPRTCRSPLRSSGRACPQRSCA